MNTVGALFNGSGNPNPKENSTDIEQVNPKKLLEQTEK